MTSAMKSKRQVVGSRDCVIAPLLNPATTAHLTHSELLVMSRADTGRRQSLLGNIQTNLGGMFKFNWNSGQPGGNGPVQPPKLHSPQPSLDSQITPKAEFGNPFDALGKTNGQQQPTSTGISNYNSSEIRIASC
jgi:hypothetical protein